MGTCCSERNNQVQHQSIGCDEYNVLCSARENGYYDAVIQRLGSIEPCIPQTQTTLTWETKPQTLGAVAAHFLKRIIIDMTGPAWDALKIKFIEIGVIQKLLSGIKQDKNLDISDASLIVLQSCVNHYDNDATIIYSIMKADGLRVLAKCLFDPREQARMVTTKLIHNMYYSMQQVKEIVAQSS